MLSLRIAVAKVRLNTIRTKNLAEKSSHTSKSLGLEGEKPLLKRVEGLNEGVSGKYKDSKDTNQTLFIFKN